jgi:hypothetical protein
MNHNFSSVVCPQKVAKYGQAFHDRPDFFSKEKGLAHMVGWMRCTRIEFDGAPEDE